jgi:hypothetical protein
VEEKSVKISCRLKISKMRFLVKALFFIAGGPASEGATDDTIKYRTKKSCTCPSLSAALRAWLHVQQAWISGAACARAAPLCATLDEIFSLFLRTLGTFL